ncbi:oleosin [Cynara cardunculus var. scolymus]|uniref:Oleosin n=1 Tax=Cynara cardunculus var. scolymus TaxID=59895 RepID=A0A118K684_CYNCS|nr:oleosin [Cynara cardunculus var. scolymus]KVI10292.1 Oleosin [Cynara cardunculus var. scolymus]
MGTLETRLDTADPRRSDQITGKTMLFSALVAIAVAGPLIVLMAISFCATMILFLVTAPLFVIFSPLLLAAGFVVAAAMVGLGMAAVMAIAGLAALRWVFLSFNGDAGKVIRDKVVELGERIKYAGNGWVSHLNQKVQSSPENWSARRSLIVK